MWHVQQETCAKLESIKKKKKKKKKAKKTNPNHLEI